MSTVLNGMLDQSFKDRAVQKHHGLKLAAAILQNWRKCDSWWAIDSPSESKMTVLSLLAKMLQVFLKEFKMHSSLVMLFFLRHSITI